MYLYIIIGILIIITAIAFFVFDDIKSTALNIDGNIDINSIEITDPNELADREYFDFVNFETKKFEAEFNVKQKSKWDIIGEKERREIIGTEFSKINAICFVEGFTDASTGDNPDEYDEIGFILVDLNVWNELTKFQKIQIIYHELTHCGLKYEKHVPADAAPVVSNRPANCPVSVMIDNTFIAETAKRCIGNYISYYIDDIHERIGDQKQGFF